MAGTVLDVDDTSDRFLVELIAGDRLRVNLQTDRLLPAADARFVELGLRGWSADGAILLDASADAFGSRTGNDNDEDPYDAYVDYVAPADGPVQVEVYVEGTAAETVDRTPTAYRLTALRTPL